MVRIGPRKCHTTNNYDQQKSTFHQHLFTSRELCRTLFHIRRIHLRELTISPRNGFRSREEGSRRSTSFVRCNTYFPVFTAALILEKIEWTRSWPTAMVSHCPAPYELFPPCSPSRSCCASRTTRYIYLFGRKF